MPHDSSSPHNPKHLGLFNEPRKLFKASQVQKLDQIIIHKYGIPGYSLMNIAGKFTFDCLLEKWPNAENLIIFCGSGNNGGDGYVIARLAQQSGLEVRVLTLSDPEKLAGDARLAFHEAQKNQVDISPFDKAGKVFERLSKDTVIVDAMLGTGLNAEVRGDYAEAISQCNDSPYPVVAVDIPSGLSADTGCPLGSTINASLTATFIGLKIGLFTAKGRQYAGEILFSDLNSPKDVMESPTPVAQALSLNTLLQHIPKRSRHAHKGSYGHVLLIGGNHGFGGAIALAATACARMGAGLTSVATRLENCSVALQQQAEVMTKAVEHSNELDALLEKASHIVIGPGLGQDAWAQQMLRSATASNLPLVLDADALNLICQHPEWLRSHRNTRVLTPHPGEAARLLNVNTKDIEADRLSAVKQIAAQYKSIVLLKGNGSLLCDADGNVHLCPYGNPGMASGGMGDVLSGMLGGLLAQTDISDDVAVPLAICLHANAADRLSASYGERGLLASDLIPEARAVLNGKTL